MLSKDVFQNHWFCGHCQRHFKTINATKALAHVLKKSGHHVKSCKSTIPNQYLERYVNLEKPINDKKNARDNASEKLNEELTKKNHDVTINVTNNSKRRCVDKLVSQPTISDTVRPNSYQTTMKSFENQSNSSKQLSVLKQNETQLKVACADLCHAHGLPFTLPQTARFQKVLKLAKCVSSNFQPPSRFTISNDLLDKNYEIYVEENHKKLFSECDVFGLSMLGDGATVKKLPLINILCSGVNAPAVVLEIHDCTGHLEKGKKRCHIYC